MSSELIKVFMNIRMAFMENNIDGSIDLSSKDFHRLENELNQICNYGVNPRRGPNYQINFMELVIKNKGMFRDKPCKDCVPKKECDIDKFYE